MFSYAYTIYLALCQYFFEIEALHSSSVLQADDIMKILREKLDHEFMTNKDEFIACIAKDASFRPFGDLIHSYKVNKGNCKQ